MFTIVLESQTGSNIVYYVETPNVFIGNYFAPVVTVPSPTPLGGEVYNITWSSTDLNVDDVNYYSLWLSNNEGVSYMLLAQNLTGTYWIWDATGWLQGSYIVRVRAYSLDFINFEPDVSNPPQGYLPGDFGDGFSPPFLAGTITPGDTTPPTINSPADIGYPLGTTGHFIMWSPYDLNPNGYELFLDDVMIRGGAWNSTSEIIFEIIDGLEVGIHNYTIVVFDDSYNSNSDTVMVTVYISTDVEDPILTHPPDIEYEITTTGHFISWSAYDLNPQLYMIYQDEILMNYGIWDSPTDTFVIFVDGLHVGIYNYTIIVYDVAGNSAHDTVFVTVTTSTPSSSTNTTTESGFIPEDSLLVNILIISIGGVMVAIVILIIIRSKNSG